MAVPAENHPASVLRQREETDETFLRLLYFSVRNEEFAGTGWDERQISAFLTMQFKARDAAYKLQYPDAEHLVIIEDGQPVGGVIIDRGREQLRLIDIVMHVDSRRKGIASNVIRTLKSDASSSGVPLVLHVDRTNTAAIYFYKALGFQIVGESQVLFSMEWHDA